jgi:hypothetical protein
MDCQGSLATPACGQIPYADDRTGKTALGQEGSIVQKVAQTHQDLVYKTGQKEQYSQPPRMPGRNKHQRSALHFSQESRPGIRRFTQNTKIDAEFVNVQIFEMSHALRLKDRVGLDRLDKAIEAAMTQSIGGQDRGHPATTRLLPLMILLRPFLN